MYGSFPTLRTVMFAALLGKGCQCWNTAAACLSLVNTWIKLSYLENKTLETLVKMASSYHWHRYRYIFFSLNMTKYFTYYISQSHPSSTFSLCFLSHLCLFLSAFSVTICVWQFCLLLIVTTLTLSHLYPTVCHLFFPNICLICFQSLPYSLTSFIQLLDLKILVFYIITKFLVLKHK